MNYSMIFVLLLSCMLVIMLMRIRVPIGAKVVGKTVGEVRLNFRERLLLQRMNIYAIAIVLISTAVTGQLHTLWELLVIFTAMAILLMPVRYIITSEGVAMNNVVFRQWDEFTGFEIKRRGVRLLPQDGLRPFDFRVLDKHEEELIALLHRCSRHGGPETQILRKAVMPLNESPRESNETFKLNKLKEV